MRGTDLVSSKPYDFVKRALDILASAVILVLASPVVAVVALLVARNLGRPVFFRQPRPGRYGEVFTMIKFRTMKASDPDSGLVTDADRLTPFGARLRSTSLDELPTLVNVLRGDMSIVGPRPLLIDYLNRYTPEQARRHEVRPGVTGLAQVAGRNAVAWDDRFRLDVQYVDSRSLVLDARVLLRTVKTVLRREGISGEGSATMQEFRGSEETGND